MKKQTPLLMCGEMVCATLRQENPKTQTRRILKPQPNGFIPDKFCSWAMWGDEVALFDQRDPEEGVVEEWKCRYGQPGDLIWVKETHRFDGLDPKIAIRDRRMDEISYRADMTGDRSAEDCPWRPSIFMPRWASRIDLEIVKIRVERLQDISDADALAEGCEMEVPEKRESDGRVISFPKNQPHPSGKGEVGWDSAVEWYHDLWNDLNLSPKPIYETDEENGKKCIVAYEAFPWSDEDFDAEYPACREGRTYRGLPLTVTANPWVWVISFKRIKP